MAANAKVIKSAAVSDDPTGASYWFARERDPVIYSKVGRQAAAAIGVPVARCAGIGGSLQ